MRSQQQAEKAEQQRIKNLVLNYDLNDDQADGDSLPAFHYVQSTKNSVRLVGTGSINKSLNIPGRSQHSTKSDEENITPHDSDNDDASRPFTDETGSYDSLHGVPRYDKSGNTRSKQRARKLQLGDIDWYGTHRSSTASTPAERPEGHHSLDQYVVDKKSTTSGCRGSVSRRGSAQASEG